MRCSDLERIVRPLTRPTMPLRVLIARWQSDCGGGGDDWLVEVAKCTCFTWLPLAPTCLEIFSFIVFLWEDGRTDGQTDPHGAARTNVKRFWTGGPRTHPLEIAELCHIV